MIKMKHIRDISTISSGFLFVLLSLDYNYLLLGLGIFFIMIGIFRLKEYDNPKLFIGVAALILVVSLILTYFQLSSPAFTGNMLVNYIVAIVSLLFIIIITYDFTHDNKMSRDIQMGDLSPLGKIVLVIGLLIAGLIVALLMNMFIFKI